MFYEDVKTENTNNQKLRLDIQLQCKHFIMLTITYWNSEQVVFQTQNIL